MLGNFGDNRGQITALEHLNRLTTAQLKGKQGQGKWGIRQRVGNWLRQAKSRSRQTNPIAANQADILPWVIYDRFVIAAAQAWPTNFKFFTVPIGTNNKTKEDTNLEQVSRLPDPQWFNCQGIAFYFESDVLKSDIDNIMNETYMEFWIAQKIYAEGKYAYYPSAAGLAGVTTRTNESAYTIGEPLANAYYDLRLPAGMTLGENSQGQSIVTDGITGQTILQGQNFKVENYSTTFTTAGAVNFYCFLFGILSRGVQ